MHLVMKDDKRPIYQHGHRHDQNTRYATDIMLPNVIEYSFNMRLGVYICISKSLSIGSSLQIKLFPSERFSDPQSTYSHLQKY